MLVTFSRRVGIIAGAAIAVATVVAWSWSFAFTYTFNKAAQPIVTQLQTLTNSVSDLAKEVKDLKRGKRAAH